MRVVIHTPAVQVSEYELDNLDSCSDEALLAAAKEAAPIKPVELQTTAAPYVYARGLDALAQQGQQLQQAVTRLADERAAARTLARRALDEGASKRHIASQLGIARPTLDDWLTPDGDR